MLRLTLSTCALLFFQGITSFSAGVPNTVNYQARVTDPTGAPIPDGAILVKFQIYDAATGGTVLWNSGFQTVNTIDGVFSYDLGSNVALPDLFGSDTVRFLGITVGTDPEISPRTRFTSAGYVFEAQKSDIAMDADSLGGQHPSYYLDWGNMTSIPAGFADGVDDTASAIDWTVVTNIPVGFADGVDDTASAIDWTALTNVPAGFADGVDDTTSAIDWTAVTNIPAGFADGTDDVGIDQATADSRYVLEAGDTMTGDISVLGGASFGTLKHYSPLTVNSQSNWTWSVGNGWGDFSIGDGIVGLSMGVALAGGGTGDSRIWTHGGTQNIYLGSAESGEVLTVRGGVAGDNSIQVPNGAISSAEMLDEPGIASNDSSAIIVLTTGMTDLATVTITTPVAGYIYLIGRCSSICQSSPGSSITGVFQVDETAGGSFVSPYNIIAGPYLAGGDQASPIFVDRVYFKLPGTYTFRLEGMKDGTVGSVATSNSRITAMFFPTSYGSVSTLASSNPGDNPSAKAITVTDLDGSTHTAYKMDLRYYEEKARAARMAEQKAMLERTEADLELARAKAEQN